MSVNPADPKWLEILKASGWQTTALAVSCILIVVLIKQNLIPSTNSPLWIAVPSIGAVIFGCLSLAAIGNALTKAIKPGMRIDKWLLKRQKVKEVLEFIPYMTDKDREIIGYLLYHNQKMFQATQDGGYAAPLISKGVIKISLRHGQTFDASHVPFEIPNYAWSVFEENKKLFPYNPPPKGKAEKHPWALPW